MYTFKLLDTVLQGIAFLSALILLIVFDAEGYFYWISVGILIWIAISIVLNLIFLKPQPTIRLITSLFLIVLVIIFAFYYYSGTPISQLNFYFQPFSIVIIVFYFFTSILEMLKMKNKGEIDLDF